MNINVIINGKPRSIEGGISLLSLLRLLNIDPGRVAIEYNRDIVERNQFGSICLKEDDKLEIITFVGGGTVGPEGHIRRFAQRGAIGSGAKNG